MKSDPKEISDAINCAVFIAIYADMEDVPPMSYDEILAIANDGRGKLKDEKP